MSKIIFDTNFLIDIFRFKVDLDQIKEIVGKTEFFVLENVKKEIETISKTKGRTGTYAKLSLKFLKQKNVKVLKSEEKNTDKALIEFAKKGYIIATNDRNLRKKIKELNLKIIYLRGKKKIMMS
jgi:hypothetical protein